MACCEDPYCSPHRFDPPRCVGGSWNADGSVHTAPRYGNTYISANEADTLVQRACGDTVTQEAKSRLSIAVLSHNDGRVLRFLAIAATEREAATGDVNDQRWEVWKRNLRYALEESWPVWHPAYRRADA